MRHIFLPFVLAAVACAGEPKGAAGGDAARGRQLVETQYLCGACHSIPGLAGPRGTAGPPLDHLAARRFIARTVPNDPETMVRYLQNPQALDPVNVMPNLGIDEKDARDITAFLFTLK